MKRIKILSALLLITALAFSLSLTAYAESSAEDVQETSGNEVMVMLIIAAILAVLAVISVLLVNKKTKKYRQAFKKRKKKK